MPAKGEGPTQQKVVALLTEAPATTATIVERCGERARNVLTRMRAAGGIVQDGKRGSPWALTNGAAKTAAVDSSDKLRDECICEVTERGPLALRDIASAVGKAPHLVLKALRRAAAAGQLTVEGLARAARWSLAKSAPKRVAVPKRAPVAAIVVRPAARQADSAAVRVLRRELDRLDSRAESIREAIVQLGGR